MLWLLKRTNGESFYGILSKMRHSADSEENERKRIRCNGMYKVRLQETRRRKEGGAESRQGDPAQATDSCGGNWKGRTETEDPSNRKDRVSQVRKQSCVRVASAD